LACNFTLAKLSTLDYNKKRDQSGSLFFIFVLLKTKEMFTIGITGGTASGKTTLVKKVIAHYGSNHVSVLSQDAYYKSNEKLCFEDRAKLNFDHPNSIDFDLLYTHLLSLKKGESIASPVYSFKKHRRTTKKHLVSPKKILILEGILVLHDKRIVKLLDMKVFMEASEKVRLQRRIDRDHLERGRTKDQVKNRFQNTLKPMHILYIEPSKRIADILIQNDKNNNDAFHVLLNSIPLNS
jgi:uridine kinase